ncbi:MAG TPA: sulfite exporter TauE/SafE family protein [Caldithrix sp.]|nr:sulfite exporter TauE/SafE family protein [Caldithrix sp.]
MNYILIFFISILTATASAMVGLGGGLLLIPFIVLIFGFPLKIVAGTMLFAMVPYTIVATRQNLKSGYVNFRIGLTMEAGSVLGVITGANVSAFLPDLLLKTVFILVIVYLMLTLQIPKDSSYNYVARLFSLFNRLPPFMKKCRFSEERLSLTALILTGFLAGFFSGMLGIGGGFLKTPVLIVGVGLPAKTAVGTALFMIFITASTGTITHAFLGHIHYQLGIVIILGMIIGAYLGSKILKSQPDQRVKKYIFIAMLLAGIMTLFR